MTLFQGAGTKNRRLLHYRGDGKIVKRTMDGAASPYAGTSMPSSRIRASL